MRKAIGPSPQNFSHLCRLYIILLGLHVVSRGSRGLWKVKLKGEIHLHRYGEVIHAGVMLFSGVVALGSVRIL